MVVLSWVQMETVSVFVNSDLLETTVKMLLPSALLDPTNRFVRMVEHKVDNRGNVNVYAQSDIMVKTVRFR